MPSASEARQYSVGEQNMLHYSSGYRRCRVRFNESAAAAASGRVKPPDVPCTACQGPVLLRGGDGINLLVKIGCDNTSLVTMIINADDFGKLQLKRENVMDLI